jgi:hypothetical protein
MKLATKSVGPLFLVIVWMPFITHMQALGFQQVQWNFTAVPVNDSEAELICTASLDDGWYIYSQFIREGGLLPTTFTFRTSDDYSLLGNVVEVSTPIKGYDKEFRQVVSLFTKTAVFIQRVKVHSHTTVIKGAVEFMIRRDEASIQADRIDFNIAVRVKKPERKEQNKSIVIIDSIQRFKFNESPSDSAKIASAPLGNRSKIGVKQVKTTSPFFTFLTTLVYISIIFVMLLPFIIMRSKVSTRRIRAPQLVSFFLRTSSARHRNRSEDK